MGNTLSVKVGFVCSSFDMTEIANKKRKAATRRKVSDDSDGDAGVDNELLEEIVEWQRARKRPKGLSVEELNAVKDPSSEQKVKEGKKQKVGGYVDAKTLKKEMEAEDLHQITSFAVETNKRDEDEPLKKYVEERLAQIKGDNTREDIAESKMRKAEDRLFELPENIKELTHKKKTEETLSDQMLSGIPEVDLGIEVKIRNIEATEEAKMKLLRERLNKKDKGILEFVPNNVAVNFAQHNRCKFKFKIQPL